MAAALFACLILMLPGSVPAAEEEAVRTPGQTAKTIEKVLPVVIQYTGNTAFGYEVATAKAAPDMVTLRGPADPLRHLDAIYTHTIDISGTSESITREVALDIPENIDVLSLKLPVSATIIIEKKMTEKAFAAIPIHGINAQYPYIIRPPRIDINVRGAMLFFEKTFTKEQIQVFIDLEGLAPGIYAKPAVIDLPENLILTEAEPRIFTVEIKAEKRTAEE